MDNNQVSRTNNWEVLAAESNYCPRELARLCHVSLRTLQRRFATHYQMTISDWMRQIRLAKAYARVVAGEPIKYVAYDLGFKQLSHFSRVFKEVHGVAPSFVSPRARAKANGASPNGVPALQTPPVQILTMPGVPAAQNSPIALGGNSAALAKIAV